VSYFIFKPLFKIERAVVRSLSRSGQFDVRAITRNANSDAAKKLASLKNVSIVEGDLDDASSVEKVLKDCYGGFLVTDSSRGARGDAEVQQGLTFVNAAIKNNLKHIIFSGLEAVEPVIKKICVHFDYKTKVEDYALKLKDKIIFTSVRMPCYFESIKMFLRKNDDGYVLNLPMENKRMFGLCIEDCGDCVTSIFQNPEKFKSKLVGLSADNLTQTEYLEIINKYLAPIKVKDGQLTLQQYLDLNKYPGAQDHVDMFEFYQTQKMERDIELTKSLNTNLLSFDSWMKNNTEFFLAPSKK
jgi:hypothetical protein